jgi:ubiquinone biosynthesis protein UbiJ
MIDQLVNQAAAAMLNRMLAREAWARDKLVPFAGRAARIEALPFALLLKIAHDGTMVAHDTGEPSVTIGLSLSSLPLALLEPSKALQDVRLVGDAEFAQALSFVLQNPSLRKSCRALSAMRLRCAWWPCCGPVHHIGASWPSACSKTRCTTSSPRIRW